MTEVGRGHHAEFDAACGDYDKATERIIRGYLMVEGSRTVVGRSLGRLLIWSGQGDAQNAEIRMEISGEHVGLAEQVRQMEIENGVNPGEALA